MGLSRITLKIVKADSSLTENHFPARVYNMHKNARVFLCTFLRLRLGDLTRRTGCRSAFGVLGLSREVSALAKHGNHNGIYGGVQGLNESFRNAIEGLFPTQVPADVADRAVARLVDDVRNEMKKGLNKHRLTGETSDALTAWGFTYAGSSSADKKATALVGIPRDGNVRDEHPKGAQYRRGRGSWKNKTVKGTYGYLGDGAFYKGIYLEFGHGSFRPQNWFKNAIAKTKRRVPDIVKNLLTEGLLEGAKDSANGAKNG